MPSELGQVPISNVYSSTSPTLPSASTHPFTTHAPDSYDGDVDDEIPQQAPVMTSTSRSFATTTPRDKKGPLCLPTTANWLDARDGLPPMVEVILRTKVTTRLCHEMEIGMAGGSDSESVFSKATEAQEHMKRVMEVAKECQLALMGDD